MWSIKLTYKYNLWLVVSLKWIIQEQGFISSRQRDCFLFYSILLWLILPFEGTRFDTCSHLDQEYEYKRSSLKAAIICEEAKLGRILLGQTNNNSFFACDLYQKSLCHSSRAQISCKTTQCCSQLQENKKNKTMAGRKNKIFSCLQSEVPKVCFSIFCGRAQAVNHSSWTSVSTQIWVINLDRICLGLLSLSIQNPQEIVLVKFGSL